MTGKSLISPTAKEIAFCIFWEKEANLVKTIPLANDAVSRQITDTGSNIKDQFTQIIQCIPLFAIQAVSYTHLEVPRSKKCKI